MEQQVNTMDLSAVFSAVIGSLSVEDVAVLLHLKKDLVEANAYYGLNSQVKASVLLNDAVKGMYGKLPEYKKEMLTALVAPEAS
ncbi:hypothetical protein [Vibrio barjaei]|uniref:hypothetical protein n=1 Tax=Vibrio barjaei TaxID=1676683 RepID=UPI002283E35B|nr:hypothetical protein [Vibrio barjaei]MCY9873004.1 hypothetical protein [Vibrio barjaei]